LTALRADVAERLELRLELGIDRRVARAMPGARARALAGLGLGEAQAEQAAKEGEGERRSAETSRCSPGSLARS